METNCKIMMVEILTQMYKNRQIAEEEVKDSHIKIISIVMGTSDKFEFYCYTKGKTHRVVNDKMGLKHTVSIN